VFSCVRLAVSIFFLSLPLLLFNRLFLMIGCIKFKPKNEQRGEIRLPSARQTSENLINCPHSAAHCWLNQILIYGRHLESP
jgi:hypothetical protein